MEVFCGEAALKVLDDQRVQHAGCHLLPDIFGLPVRPISADPLRRLLRTGRLCRPCPSHLEDETVETKNDVDKLRLALRAAEVSLKHQSGLLKPVLSDLLIHSVTKRPEFVGLGVVEEHILVSPNAHVTPLLEATPARTRSFRGRDCEPSAASGIRSKCSDSPAAARVGALVHRSAGVLMHLLRCDDHEVLRQRGEDAECVDSCEAHADVLLWNRQKLRA